MLSNSTKQRVWSKKTTWPSFSGRPMKMWKRADVLLFLLMYYANLIASQWSEKQCKRKCIICKRKQFGPDGTLTVTHFPIWVMKLFFFNLLDRRRRRLLINSFRFCDKCSLTDILLLANWFIYIKEAAVDNYCGNI